MSLFGDWSHGMKGSELIVDVLLVSNVLYMQENTAPCSVHVPLVNIVKCSRHWMPGPIVLFGSPTYFS
jgi:hypothetical protein